MDFETAKLVIESHGMKVVPPSLPKTTMDLGDCGLQITGERVDVLLYEDDDKTQLRESQVDMLRMALNERHEWREKWL